MTSEDLNLPASLERLEINPESRVESSKTDENPFSYRVSSPLGEAPECSLETLSLNAVCPKGSCLCNKKKEGSGRVVNNSNGTSSSLKSIVHHRRPILRRSKLNREVLRAPILRLGGSESASEGISIGKTSTSFKTKLDGNTTVIANGTNSEPVSLCCTPVASCSILPSTVLQRPIQSPINYITSAASSSHCCALQARSINNNSNNTTMIATNTNLSSSSTSTDDTNIDELASYFDLLVHIPKKMSVMAEMMYI